MVRFSTRMNLLKGSAIRELLALANKPEILSFAGGMPAPELFPVDKIKAATDAVLEEQGKIALQYSSTNGFEHFRQQIADHRMLRFPPFIDVLQRMFLRQQALELPAVQECTVHPGLRLSAGPGLFRARVLRSGRCGHH